MDAEGMACDVAKELRKRGIWADVPVLYSVALPRQTKDHSLRWWHHSMYCPDFAGMTALEIADEIQAQEARRAQILGCERKGG